MKVHDLEITRSNDYVIVTGTAVTQKGYEPWHFALKTRGELEAQSVELGLKGLFMGVESIEIGKGI